jgi:hypothetical protein
MDVDVTARNMVTGQYNDAAHGPMTVHPKALFRPDNPFGSLTAGNHQFTILGDWQHGHPAISRAIADNLKNMAQSGVKHLILEFPPFPDTDDILDRLYSDPPTITDDEIRGQSRLFESVHAESPEKMIEDGLNYAEMLIESRKHGIRVHFGGDEAGHAIRRAMREVLAREQEFIEANPGINKIYEEWIENPDLLRTQGLDDDAVAKAEKELVAYGEQRLVFTREWLDLNEERAKERMGYETEQQRARRFIDMANGEKAVIFWGSDHHIKKKDLNEALDEALQKDAFKKGTDAPEPTRSMTIYPSESSFKGEKTEAGAQEPHMRYFALEQKAELTNSGREIMDPGNAVPASRLAP